LNVGADVASVRVVDDQLGRGIIGGVASFRNSGGHKSSDLAEAIRKKSRFQTAPISEEEKILLTRGHQPKGLMQRLLADTAQSPRGSPSISKAKVNSTASGRPRSAPTAKREL